MPRSLNGPGRGADLVALLEDVDIHKGSLIRVTGPSGLSALLWLCRHDYEEVGYLRPGLAVRMRRRTRSLSLTPATRPS